MTETQKLVETFQNAELKIQDDSFEHEAVLRTFGRKARRNFVANNNSNNCEALRIGIENPPLSILLDLVILQEYAILYD